MIFLKYKQIFFILLFFILSLLYSYPNFYGEDPVIIIKNDFFKSNNTSLQNIFSDLNFNNSSVKSIKRNENDSVIRFFSTEEQFNFYTFFKQKFGSESFISLNILNAHSNLFFEKIGAYPMKFGLDLRGGVSFLIKVDTEINIKNFLSSKSIFFEKELKKKKIFYDKIEIKNDFLNVYFLNNSDKNSFLSFFNKNLDDFDVFVNDCFLCLNIKKSKENEITNDILNQSINILSKRVNELGVIDSIVLRHGKNKILIEMPGIQDINRAKSILGKIATLEFMMVDSENSVKRALNGKKFKDSRLFYTKDNFPILLKNKIILSGESIVHASSGFDQLKNMPCVNIRLGKKDIKLFEDMTNKNIGNLMAIVYKENFVDNDGNLMFKESVISVAKIMSALSRDFQVTGLNLQESKDLALLLRSGVLPSTLSIEEERIIGPSIGEKNIISGVKSILFSFFVIFIFMILIYKSFGFISCFVVILNIFLLVSIMSLLNVTLTLPGLAGISLTIGMSIDSNVLIFERIKEELKLSNNLFYSIENGFKNSLSSIIDTNITTLIVGMTLFLFGHGPLKGFAITLCIGIFTTIYSAVFVTKHLLLLFFGRKI